MDTMDTRKNSMYKKCYKEIPKMIKNINQRHILIICINDNANIIFKSNLLYIPFCYKQL